MVTELKISPSADFFIHPDYRRTSGELVIQEVERYETALHDRIDGSELPILIYDPSQPVQTGDFWDCFPAEQRFPSPPGCGELAPEPNTHNGFNGLLNEHQVLEGVLHGSYLAQCVQAFKTHLRASAESGVIYYDSDYESRTRSDRDIYRPKTVRFGLVLRDLERGNLSPPFRHSGLTLPPEYAEDARVFCTSKTS
jgi:hypothetical protein